MGNKHIIPCGGVSLPGAMEAGATRLPLALLADGAENNVVLRIENLPDELAAPVSKAFEDLLEIAAYVHTADQATTRGGEGVDVFGQSWRRHFDFHIPVRELELWNSDGVKAALRNTLEFLSDDIFDFTFYPAKRPRPVKDYFQTTLLGALEGEREGVALFSGGLDSLAGAVEAAMEHKERLMLVNHRPTPKLNTIHRNLQTMLAKKAGKYAPRHLHVVMHKRKALNREYTQRTRSFLYVALGATVARMLGHKRVRFYENGVVSMNLPVCAQVVGSGATRTTHPRTLNGFEKLLTEIAGETFAVANPFIWDTKGEVIGKILKAGCGEMIGESISCAHTWLFTTKHPHCGTCSQCIDRRFGIVAANAESFDPAGGYANDVFTGPRSEKEDRMMAATYVERASEIGKLRDVTELVKRYPEALRLFTDLPGKPLAAAERVLTLHKRHAAEVVGAIDKMLAANVKGMRDHTLSPDCLLKIVYESRTREARPAVIAKGRPASEQQEERWQEEKEGPNVYRLRKGHKVWTLVFRGEPETLKDERAVELVEYLLKHPPDEAIHAMEWENRVDGSPLIDGVGGIETSDGSVIAVGGVIQEGVGKKLAGGISHPQLKLELAELRAAAADKSSLESEQAAAQAQLTDFLRAHDRGGKLIGGASQAVDRVRKAIRGFIKELKEAEASRGKPNTVLRGFGDHLEECLWRPSMGGKQRIGAAGRAGCFTYERPTGVFWRE